MRTASGKSVKSDDTTKGIPENATLDKVLYVSGRVRNKTSLNRVLHNTGR
jgi:hypothetical protein